MLWIRTLPFWSVALVALSCSVFLACSDEGAPAQPPTVPSDAPASVDSDEGEVQQEAESGEPAGESPSSGTPSSAAGLSDALSSLLAGLPAADRSKANPLSGQQDAITAGRSEYMSMCFVCHGAAGKGDGPASAATPTTPSDLSDTARAGLLSDGDRFAVMRNGIPGTSMPASGANLNDDQIWRILSYVETLVSN
jgi:mono/diheme cytochrome c family protein